ncbi:MAG: PilZ domain-containing protein [Bdellovibrionota bacterium]
MRKAIQETAKERLEAVKQEENPLYNTDRKIRAKRLKVSFPVQVTHKGSPIHGWAEACNISFSGMLLLTNFPMNVRDEFNVEFTLPGHDIPVQALARVVRITEAITHDSPTVMAISFIQIEQNVSKIISGFVLENLSSY